MRIKTLLKDLKLHTVCQEALCPNIGQCFEEGTATFLILGEICTRRCGFCAVASGCPLAPDPQEPERVAQAVQRLGLKYAVVTSVSRDDLPDGGAAIFAQTIARIREYNPECGIEVLVPDFGGSAEALQRVIAAKPDVLNHNVETVPRLYPAVRPKARYQRSLELLRRAKGLDTPILTKSGLMVGLGEDWGEVLQTMADLRGVGCDLLTIGQYLQPSARHLPIARYYTPQEFEQLKVEGEEMGFRHVESGPLVRSSYRAHHQVREAPCRRG